MYAADNRHTCTDCQVDLRKVNISVLRPWIAKTVTDILRFEDDIVVEFAFSMLEDAENPFPDPRKMQVNMLGFMDKYGAAHYCTELWKLLLSAQETVGGVPAEVSFLVQIPGGRGQGDQADCIVHRSQEKGTGEARRPPGCRRSL